ASSRTGGAVAGSIGEGASPSSSAIARKILRRCPKRIPRSLEVLLRQIADDREVNGVVGEPLGVLTQANRCQPLGDAPHGTSRGPAGRCCPCAATGHGAAPPSSVMNSRRLMSSMGSPPGGTRCASLPQAQDAPEAPAGPWGRPESF